MRRFAIVCLALALTVMVPGLGSRAQAAGGHPVIKLQTSLGDIVLELDAEKAPVTVENFVRYVKDGHYDGTIFHRVIPNFMIQGGGFDADMKQKETRAPIKNEADNGLKNDKYTIAMARTSEPHSATAQFFINVEDNPELDHRDDSAEGFGYCVFGKVEDGMDVVDKIRKLKTKAQGEHEAVPLDMVVITNVSRFE